MNKLWQLLLFNKILRLEEKYNKHYFETIAGLCIVFLVGIATFYTGLKLYFSHSMAGRIICLAGLLIILYYVCVGLIMLISGMVGKDKGKE